MNLKTKQTLSVVFSVGGAIGTLTTVLLARKAAMKEQEMRTPIGCVYQEILPETSKRDQINKLLPVYAPTIASGVLTIGSIIGSTVMSHKAQASLMSMAVLADQGWKKYKHQVKSTLGLDAHKDVLKGIAKKESKDISMIEHDEIDTRELYYDEIVGYFRAKSDDVAFAYAEINEMLNTDYRNQLVDIYDFVTIGTFLKLANAELLDKNMSNDILNGWGWTMDYLIENYKWCWIHMKVSHESSDDGVVPINVISWVEDPIIIDIENVYGPGRLSLEGIDVEEFDDILHKKYTQQEDLYEKKDEIK